jgi:3-hydroxyisobutyrate dehydrogenase-like beta-hydroxyacid dehydrogenase
MAKETVGFIGVGEMGWPMAKGILDKGIDLMVHDIREDPVKELKKLGAKVAGSPGEIGANCAITIIMVVDKAQAKEVIQGKNGILTTAKKGSMIVAMSTLDPFFCQEMAKIAAEKGVGFIDAPVSGGRGRAEAHTLTIMVGGEESLLKKCRYVLEAMGNNIVYMGKVGNGQVMKLANNSIVHALLIGTAGGLTLAAKAGIPAERFLKILDTSTGRNWVAQNWDYFWSKGTPEGKGSLYVTKKDIAMTRDTARAYGLSLPLVEILPDLDLAEIIKNTQAEIKKK